VDCELSILPVLPRHVFVNLVFLRLLFFRRFVFLDFVPVLLLRVEVRVIGVLPLFVLVELGLFSFV
jgi:hypothetical protein